LQSHGDCAAFLITTEQIEYLGSGHSHFTSLPQRKQESAAASFVIVMRPDNNDLVV
jgi:hypothetical protein